MRVSVPLYIHSDKPHGGKAATYTVRPLMFHGHDCRGSNLGKATADCVSQLRKSMNKLCRTGHYERVMDQTFAPDFRVNRYRLDFHLRSTFRRGAFVVVSFRALDRTMAFLPTREDMWFEVPKSAGLEATTQRVLTEFLLEREKDGDNLDEWMSSLTSAGRSWVTTVDFDIET